LDIWSIKKTDPDNLPVIRYPYAYCDPTCISMNPQHSPPVSGTCSRCGECCRWLPLISVQECKPHYLRYLRDRGLKEIDGYFLADAPCRHLQKEEPDGSGKTLWRCAIYENRSATCRDFCGKALSMRKEYYVPEGCTMAGGSEPEDG
jgi:Fe-S-cluster containining protein